MANDIALVRERDWQAVADEFRRTAPYNYAVLDDFLTGEAAAETREYLSNHKGWSFLNAAGAARILFIRNFHLQAVDTIASELLSHATGLFEGLALVEHSAFMNRENDGLSIHADNGVMTLNLYLTPDECNLDKASGGMVLYDVKRSKDQLLHEFNSEPWCSDYFKSHTRGGRVRIDYRFNRAILFDAATLHSAERMRFVGTDAGSHRLNVALRFDRPDEFSKRFDPYRPSARADRRDEGREGDALEE